MMTEHDWNYDSGFMMDKEGKIDTSLIAKLKSKTLVTKDGDVLLQAPNLGQILSEARDIYDRVARPDYRNGIYRNYEGHSMTWILCGTEALRALDRSELGERFLDCRLVEEMDEHTEREIALKRVREVAREMGMVSNGKAESRDTPERIVAKQRTGGYILYLKENAVRLFKAVQYDEEIFERCVRMGEFISFLRSRPSESRESKPQRELCVRLSSQICRLASCLAVVLNKTRIDREVMRRVRRVALDTARGRTFDIIGHLYRAGNKGIEMAPLLLLANEDEKDLQRLLRFLRDIKAISMNKVTQRTNRTVKVYKLTPRMRELYQDVVRPERGDDGSDN